MSSDLDRAERVETIVVGNGLFGSATARHLAERGREVLLVGAPRARWGETLSGSGPHRVYSSHHDAARLTRRQDRNAEWAAITRRAIDNYRQIEQRSGISLYEPVGCLIASRPGGDGISADPRTVMDTTGVEYEFFAPGDRSWRERWPDLAFPDTHYVAFEPDPAGYIRPLALIEAQNVLALAAGASIIQAVVTSVAPVGAGSNGGAGYRVTTADGSVRYCETVVIAAGAFTNFNRLLGAPLDLSRKSEVIVLGEVTAADAARLAQVPTVKYLLDVDPLEAIYMISAVQYPDGRYYIKMGANTSRDFELDTLADMQRWFETDTDDEYLPLYQPALQALWPKVDFVSFSTRPCVITYSEDRMPVIAQVAPGVVVAAAGNGGGAKGSDAWGELAADRVSGPH